MTTPTGDDGRQYRTPGWPDKHMLEAAMGLLANAVAFDARSGWDQAKKEWMDAYHRIQRAEQHSVRGRWATAGGPAAVGMLIAGSIGAARAILSAVVPGKTPPERPEQPGG